MALLTEGSHPSSTYQPLCRSRVPLLITLVVLIFTTKTIFEKLRQLAPWLYFVHYNFMPGAFDIEGHTGDGSRNHRSHLELKGTRDRMIESRRYDGNNLLAKVNFMVTNSVARPLVVRLSWNDTGSCTQRTGTDECSI